MLTTTPGNAIPGRDTASAERRCGAARSASLRGVCRELTLAALHEVGGCLHTSRLHSAAMRQAILHLALIVRDCGAAYTLASVAVLSVYTTACSPAPTARDDASPHAELPRHELVFAHHSDATRKDYDLWRMCGDGTQMASLVTEPGQQLAVTISPTGDELAYTSGPRGHRDVWTRSFDSADAVNVTDHPADDVQPAWGSDGRLAFFSDRDAERLELYVLDLDEHSVRRLTENEHYDSGAAWAPDGGSIAFTRYFAAPEGGDHSGRGEVMLLDLASGEERQLTELGGYNGGVSFSPDGRLIAFHRSTDGGSELWIMNADGSEPRALTDTFIDEYSPEWSPSGRWIAFTAGVNNDSLGTFDLWIMRPDGTQRTLLNRAPNTEMNHKWRPGEHYCR